MAVRAPQTLAGILAGTGLLYAIAFWGMVTFDADSAWSRFEALNGGGFPERAVSHGDRALRLADNDGIDAVDRPQMAYLTAIAHDRAGKPSRAIELYRTALLSPFGSELTEEERMAVNHRIATNLLIEQQPVEAAALVAGFVDAAGDFAANREIEPDETAEVYLNYAQAALPSFADQLAPTASKEIISGNEQTRLALAEKLTTLGGYYGTVEGAEDAAAGLLAAAYRTRYEILSPDHPDTSHTALLLGPVYERLDRLKDAESLYLATFHAQERAKGANNPELSLYIRLLANVYEKQRRFTEAAALKEHMRGLFRDAFGARRFLANRDRDRTADIARPISAEFPLTGDYVPGDLIQASAFSIPVSKDPSIDEMKIRAAIIDDDTTMPKMLADLIGECRSEGERLSLRSGYRSYRTQDYLYNHTEHGGKVTAPGTSEHQSGLAADIDVNGRFMRSTDRAYQCFEAQAWRYGFILSYPQNNDYLDAEDGYEPWHWRFVGPQAALLYREIGPMGRPQEFLAALPCYRERALSGLYFEVGQADVCLAGVMPEESAEMRGGDDKYKDAG